MMKKILLLLFFFPSFVFAQFQADQDDNLYFEKVYEADFSKAELKEKVYEWIAVNFNDANHVIKMNTENKIVTNGLFSYNIISAGQPIDMKVNFSLNTEFKDGRYKVLINNLEIDNSYPVKASEAGGFEVFKEAYKESLESMDKSTRKYAEKILKDEDKLREMYNQGVAVQDQNINNIKKEVENMAKSIYSAVKETSNSDW